MPPPPCHVTANTVFTRWPWSCTSVESLGRITLDNDGELDRGGESVTVLGVAGLAVAVGVAVACGVLADVGVGCCHPELCAYVGGRGVLGRTGCIGM